MKNLIIIILTLLGLAGAGYVIIKNTTTLLPTYDNSQPALKINDETPSVEAVKPPEPVPVVVVATTTATTTTRVLVKSTIPVKPVCKKYGYFNCVVAPAIETLDVKNCRDLEDPAYADEYKDLYSLGLGPDLTKKLEITRDVNKTLCTLVIAVYKKDASLCPLVDSYAHDQSMSKEECLREVANCVKNPSAQGCSLSPQ